MERLVAQHGVNHANLAVTSGDGALIGSIFTLVRQEPVLRQRMLFAGLMFAAFSAVWTTMAFLLAGDPHLTFNRAYDPSEEETRDRMRRYLRKLETCAGATCSQGTP